MFVEISLLQCSHLPVSKDCGGIEHVDRRLRRESGRLLSSFLENSRKNIVQFACCQRHTRGSDKNLSYTKMRAFSLSEENSERGMLTTMNYLTKTEKNGETGIKLKTT